MLKMSCHLFIVYDHAECLNGKLTLSVLEKYAYTTSSLNWVIREL